MNSIKIAIISNIMMPYRVDQVEEYRKNFPNITLYTTEKDPYRRWFVEKKEYFIFLKEWIKIKNFYLNKGLKDVVKKNDFLLIGGFDQPTHWYLAFLCKLYQKPYAILFDGISPSSVRKYEKKFKHKIKKYMVDNAAALFANGEIGKNYFQTIFNYPETQIYNQYLNVKGQYFLEHIKEKSVINKIERQKLGISDTTKVILYSGRTMNRKRIFDLIYALHILCNEKQSNNQYVLILMGDGEEKQSLEQLCKESKIDYIFIGHKAQEELYKTYFMANLLVVPSENEAWGLVLNEALLANLAIVASDDCGASDDLIENGRNGYIFECTNIQDLVDNIDKALKIPTATIELTSKKILAEWNNRSSAKEFQRMINDIEGTKDKQ